MNFRTMPAVRLLTVVILGIGCLSLLSGCGSDTSTPPANQIPPTPVVPFQVDASSAHDETEHSGVVQGASDANEDHHHHAHSAPHGGALIALGDHLAHLELVLDSESGKLSAYVLDGEASNAVRLAQPTIEILLVKDPATKQGENLVLKAVANVLTGEKETDSSEFSITTDILKGKTEFSGILQSIEIKGKEIKGVPFSYPGGAE